MKQYLEALQTVKEQGVVTSDRTGTGRKRYHGLHMRFDMSDGTLPVVTTKKMPLRIIFEELKWFLTGDTNIKALLDKNIHIWTADAYKAAKATGSIRVPLSEVIFEQRIKEDKEYAREFGDLGPIYGQAWRRKKGVSANGEKYVVDQIAKLIEQIKNTPESTRHIVMAWDEFKLQSVVLPPCHFGFQVTVINNVLNLQIFQRSGDMFLGVPFNITSYAMLLAILAEYTGCERGVLTHTITDAHIYLNHLTQVDEQLARETFALPTLTIKDLKSYKDISDIEWSDFVVTDYKAHPTIKGDLSV